MALRECRDCKGQVSKSAKACPHCGAPVRRESSGTLIVLLLVVLIIAWAVNGFDSPKKSSTGAGESSEQDANGARQAHTQKAPPDKEISVLVDVAAIAGKNPREIEEVLGNSRPGEGNKHGDKLIYRGGIVEIIFIDGKADWITVNGMDGVPFDSEAIRVIGFESSNPTFKNELVIRWEKIDGIKSASIFSGTNGCSYAYVKVATL